jgi:hypothetical protein
MLPLRSRRSWAAPDVDTISVSAVVGTEAVLEFVRADQQLRDRRYAAVGEHWHVNLRALPQIREQEHQIWVVQALTERGGDVDAHGQRAQVPFC